jgi:hypothetical protein
MYIKVQCPCDEALIIGGGGGGDGGVEGPNCTIQDPLPRSAISCYKSHCVRDIEKNIGS